MMKLDSNEKVLTELVSSSSTPAQGVAVGRLPANAMTAAPTKSSTAEELDELIELTIVMPCLNESETLEVCIRKAQKAIKDHGIRGEVLVADNGSTDKSPEIATRLGARVVHVTEKGYGNALMGGIRAARGKYILMGDADDSYDFLEAPNFLAKLREGFELVQGCRLPSG